jgi:hypothetical protein
MAFAAIVAFLGLTHGVQEEVPAEESGASERDAGGPESEHTALA